MLCDWLSAPPLAASPSPDPASLSKTVDKLIAEENGGRKTPQRPRSTIWRSCAGSPSISPAASPPMPKSRSLSWPASQRRTGHRGILGRDQFADRWAVFYRRSAPRPLQHRRRQRLPGVHPRSGPHQHALRRDDPPAAGRGRPGGQSAGNFVHPRRSGRPVCVGRRRVAGVHGRPHFLRPVPQPPVRQLEPAGVLRPGGFLRQDPAASSTASRCRSSASSSTSGPRR